MQITIDTNEPLSTTDRQILAAYLGITDQYAADLQDSIAESKQRAAEEKPKATRTRRTKAQIAEDEAKAAAEKAEQVKPEEEPAEEPTPDSENAESDAAQDTGGATLADLTELATELVTKDRAKMLEILEKHEIRRASQTPPEKLDEVVADIRAALA